MTEANENGEMHLGLLAFVPLVVGDAGRENDHIITLGGDSLAGDFDLKSALKDEEQLIDGVDVRAGSGAAAKNLDRVDDAGNRTPRGVSQGLEREPTPDANPPAWGSSTFADANKG